MSGDERVDGPVTLYFDDARDVGLDLGGLRLVPGVRGEAGLPLERFLDAFLVGRDGEVVARVTSPEDLASHLRSVPDAEAALSFVRLFTSPETQHLFHDDRAVVEARIVPDTTEPAVATIPASEARRLGIEDARVEEDGAGYRIIRPLVVARAPGSPRTVVRREERVSESGAYELIADDEVGELPPGAVLTPYFE